MRAKTPSGGQIALRHTGAMQFQITSRGKDYAGMSKAKIEIEMVDLLTSILSMTLEPVQVINILKQIPIEKMPRFQQETTGYGKVITFSKRDGDFSTKSDCYSFLVEESMGQILIKDGMIIEKRHFNNLKLKEYLRVFANMLFDI